jgi:hypothetical protein
MAIVNQRWIMRDMAVVNQKWIYEGYGNHASETDYWLPGVMGIAVEECVVLGYDMVPEKRENA